VDGDLIAAVLVYCVPAIPRRILVHSGGEKVETRTKAVVAALFLVVVATLATTATAQKAGQKPALTWALHISEARGPVRTADLSSPLGKAVSSEILGGPANGSEAAYLIYTRMPSGAHGPAMFTLPVDHLYLVLSGKMSVKIGTDTFVAAPDTGVFVPANTPHEVWNAEGEPEAHIEVIAPAPSRDLMSMLKPAEPRKIENAAQYIRPAKPLVGELRPGLNAQPILARATGSANQMRIDSVPAGSGGPRPHIHAFEQVYFEKEGTMTLTYGINPSGNLATYKVPTNAFVIIQPGVVHTNQNDGPGVERHVTLLLPQPEPNSGPLDIEVELKPPPPARGRQN
jgi:mannose-6-phosphate isomerase-like protein (cupin superfamily)